MSFRKDFVWGAATAAYQIEGAAYEDGRGESVWDVHCHDTRKNPEGKQNILDGETGDVSCDFYHHYKEEKMYHRCRHYLHYRQYIYFKNYLFYKI